MCGVGEKRWDVCPRFTSNWNLTVSFRPLKVNNVSENKGSGTNETRMRKASSIVMKLLKRASFSFHFVWMTISFVVGACLALNVLLWQYLVMTHICYVNVEKSGVLSAKCVRVPSFASVPNTRRHWSPSCNTEFVSGKTRRMQQKLSYLVARPYLQDLSFEDLGVVIDLGCVLGLGGLVDNAKPHITALTSVTSGTW